MLKKPLLTIIMPVYNIAAYLGRAFEALLKQEETNFKLIVVDDGSTDASVEIAKSYQSRFPYFQLIQKKNGGPSDARNVGMQYLDTPYFTFLDGDDWVSEGYTTFFLRAFKEHPDVDLVSCGYWLSYPNKEEKEVGHFENGEITTAASYLKLTDIFGSSMKGYCWNKAYKTAVVKRHHLTFDRDISLLEDQIFNVNYVTVTNGVYYTQKPYYHYWQRPDSIIHQHNFKKVKDNFRGNYRVWQRIISSLLEKRQEAAQRRLLRKKMAQTSRFSEERK